MNRNDKGQFDKGNPGKPQGAKNKVGSMVKDIISEVTENYRADKLLDDLNKLKPSTRIYVMAKLWEFIAPKLVRTDMKIDGDIDVGPRTIGFEE